MKKTLRHYQVVLEPMSTSFNVKGIRPVEKRQRDITTDEVGNDFWLLYAEQDEKSNPRHCYICLYTSKAEADEAREGFMFCWGNPDIEIFDYKKNKHYHPTDEFMTRPVRFIVKHVPFLP